MKRPGLFLSAPLSLALASALFAASTLAMAQPSPAADAHARYEQERQKCMTNNTQDSLATCLREAGAAQDAARKGQLSNPGHRQLTTPRSVAPPFRMPTSRPSACVVYRAPPADQYLKAVCCASPSPPPCCRSKSG